MKLRNLIVLVVLVVALFLPNVVSVAVELSMVGVSIGRESVWSRFDGVDANPSLGVSLGPFLSGSPDSGLMFGGSLDAFFYTGEIATGSTDVADYSQSFFGGSVLVGKIFGSKGSYKSLYIGPGFYRHTALASSINNKSSQTDASALGITGGGALEISKNVVVGVGFRHIFKYEDSYELFLTVGFKSD